MDVKQPLNAEQAQYEAETCINALRDRCLDVTEVAAMEAFDRKRRYRCFEFLNDEFKAAFLARIREEVGQDWEPCADFRESTTHNETALKAAIRAQQICQTTRVHFTLVGLHYRTGEPVFNFTKDLKPATIKKLGKAGFLPRKVVVSDDGDAEPGWIHRKSGL